LIVALLDPSQDREAVVGRFRRLGYTISPDRRHQVIAVEIGHESGALAACTALMRDLQWAARREGAELVWMEHQAFMVAFCSYGDQIPERRIRRWVRQAADAMGRPCCGMGVSRTVEGVESLRGAVYQAMEACELGRRVDECASPHYYEDLGLYRLLCGLRDREELACFYHETIGPLVQYDREKGAELVHTLEVFFAENANASSTARSLYVHRNTLNYRLQRIIDITGMDLDDPEARLSLQIGLKIHHLTRGVQRDA
jgi:sugar diacid utilization regulator